MLYQRKDNIIHSKDNSDQKIEISIEILNMIRNSLLIKWTFLDTALSRLEYVSFDGIESMGTDGTHLFYNADYILEQFQRRKEELEKIYLHLLLHCILQHPFVHPAMNYELWNLATDLAVVNIIEDLNHPTVSYEIDNKRDGYHNWIKIKADNKIYTTENLYTYLLQHHFTQKELRELEEFVLADNHHFWYSFSNRIDNISNQEESDHNVWQNDKYNTKDSKENEMSKNTQYKKEAFTQNIDNKERNQQENSEEDDSKHSQESDNPNKTFGFDKIQEGGKNTFSSSVQKNQNNKLIENQKNNETSPLHEREHGDSIDEDINRDNNRIDNNNKDDSNKDDSNKNDSNKDDSDKDDNNKYSNNNNNNKENCSKEISNFDNSSNVNTEQEIRKQRNHEDEFNDIKFDENSNQEDNQKEIDNSSQVENQSGVAKDKYHSSRFHDDHQYIKYNQDNHVDLGDQDYQYNQDNHVELSNQYNQDNHVELNNQNHQYNQDNQVDLNNQDNEDNQETLADQNRQDNQVNPNHNTSFDRWMEEHFEKYQDYDMKYDKEELRKEWEKISRQITISLESFLKSYGNKAGSLIDNIKNIKNQKADYTSLLSKFAVSGEKIMVDQDEFDYIYYSYGLREYQNKPFIEPLEYKKWKGIKEFVIAIDTSGSCKGGIIQAFLQKTYSILKRQENFFHKVNIHIIQCDAKIQSDFKITCENDLKRFFRKEKLYGFGGTDFRPVFEYVDTLIKEKEFKNLNGLIYFTDGIGIFPKKRPPYKTMLVGIRDYHKELNIPSWVIPVNISQYELD